MTYNKRGHWEVGHFLVVGVPVHTQTVQLHQLHQNRRTAQNEGHHQVPPVSEKPNNFLNEYI